MPHIPVLQKEVIQYLNPRPNENFIDATAGEGGHAAAILKRVGSKGEVLGIEIDPELYENLKAGEIKNRLILVNDSYVNLGKIVEQHRFGPIQGVLCDLGVSSWHLEKSGRGFSFLKEEPLDMRYAKERGLMAQDLINRWRAEELEMILKDYGEERFAKSIAKKIVEVRRGEPIRTTFQLVEIIKRATPFWYHHRSIHPATKTFQALRIAINHELDNLAKFLPQAVNILASGGRLVIISFHSLEDRIVKNFFKQKQQQNLIKILTKKPVGPGLEELGKNPRSRSAKLRAAIKL